MTALFIRVVLGNVVFLNVWGVPADRAVSVITPVMVSKMVSVVGVVHLIKEISVTRATSVN